MGVVEEIEAALKELEAMAVPDLRVDVKRILDAVSFLREVLKDASSKTTNGSSAQWD